MAKKLNFKIVEKLKTHDELVDALRCIHQQSHPLVNLGRKNNTLQLLDFWLSLCNLALAIPTFTGHANDRIFFTTFA